MLLPLLEIERGSCISSTDGHYQCTCNSDFFTFYRWAAFTIEVAVLIYCVKVLYIVRKYNAPGKNNKLKYLLLTFGIVAMGVRAFYLGFDGHRCERKFSALQESILYGVPLSCCLSVSIGIVFKWIDVSRVTFVGYQTKLFSPTLFRSYAGIVIFLFSVEVIARCIWNELLFYIYSMVFSVLTLGINLGFVVFHRALMRRMMKTINALSKKDARLKQVKTVQIYAVFGSSIMTLVFFSTIAAMLFTAFANKDAAVLVEFFWRIMEAGLIAVGASLSENGTKPETKETKNEVKMEDESD